MRLTFHGATIAVAAIAAAALAACSSNPSTKPARGDRVLAVTDRGVLRAYDGPKDDHLVVLKISPDSALMLLGAVYEELGVEITTRDPRDHTIGNRNFSKYYRLGDSPLSVYLGCGDTEYGPAANKRRVTMSLVSTVTQESGGSVIRTHLEARAEQPEFSNWSSCLTTGALENRINKLVELRNVH